MRARRISAYAFLFAGMVWILAAALDAGNRGTFMILGAGAAAVGLAMAANDTDRKT